VRVGIVGAGPAGSYFALRVAQDGGTATLFDASHPREKPCGGGLTGKALRLLPLPAHDPLPARMVESCRLEAGDAQVDVRLARPVAVAARRDFDLWLLRQALAAGARHVAERVVRVERGGRLTTSRGRDESFDLVVGADGAQSLVRRSFLGPTPAHRLAMATGWFARGEAPMTVRFASDLSGYWWLFPRPDHVGVGICGPLRRVPTRALVARLESEVRRDFPRLGEGTRYAHTIPSPSTERASLLEIVGDGWALLGDAAALADPITGEGIYYALRSATLLASTLAADGSAERYPRRLLDDFGHELLKAAALRERFYAPGFARRMVLFGARSATLRGVLADLVLGEQGYLGLKRRLAGVAPRFIVESAASRLFGVSA
jgi:flavin-dependent dehydrogenase